MDSTNLSLGIAFLGGLASFLSPCVLSLVPAYIGYLSGRTAANAGEQNRLHTLSHGLAFVLGFSLVFVGLYLFIHFIISAFSGLVYDMSIFLGKVGGIVVIIFGLYMTGVLKKVVYWLQARFPSGPAGKVTQFVAQATSYLDYDMRPQSAPDRKMGYLSSLLMGVFFSAGWSPCVGPTLTLILALAAQTGSAGQGALLLTAYSAGLAIPFLLASTQIGLLTQAIRRYGKVSHYVEIGMGLLMIVIGYMLFTGTFQRLAGLGTFIPEVDEAIVGRYLLLGLLALAVLGLIPAFIARSKGRNFYDWWFFGAGLFVVALPMALLLQPRDDRGKGTAAGTGQMDPAQRNASK